MTETNWVVVKPPRRKSDYLRRLVRTTTEVRIAQAVIPAGSIGRIEAHRQAKSTIILNVCQCCGISPVLTAHDYSGLFEFVEKVSAR